MFEGVCNQETASTRTSLWHFVWVHTSRILAWVWCEEMMSSEKMMIWYFGAFQLLLTTRQTPASIRLAYTQWRSCMLTCPHAFSRTPTHTPWPYKVLSAWLSPCRSPCHHLEPQSLCLPHTPLSFPLSGSQSTPLRCLPSFVPTRSIWIASHAVAHEGNAADSCLIHRNTSVT